MNFEPIHGFVSPGEYERFLKHIEEQVADGRLLEIPTDAEYRAGGIQGGRWFFDIEIKQRWRLVPPDFPFRGLWEALIEPDTVEVLRTAHELTLSQGTGAHRDAARLAASAHAGGRTKEGVFWRAVEAALKPRGE
jgi:hypothetical protein